MSEGDAVTQPRPRPRVTQPDPKSNARIQPELAGPVGVFDLHRDASWIDQKSATKALATYSARSVTMTQAEGVEIPLPTPDSFPFPYPTPYAIQVDLMRTVFEAIERKKIAIVSPSSGLRAPSSMSVADGWDRSSRRPERARA